MNAKRVSRANRKSAAERAREKALAKSFSVRSLPRMT